MPTVEERKVLNLNHTPNMRFIDKVQFKSYEDKTETVKRKRAMERLHKVLNRSALRFA
jgi:hypothetical protein